MPPTELLNQIIISCDKILESVGNYRRISFMNVILKLFTGILLNGQQERVDSNNILWEYQTGFRKSYSMNDKIQFNN